MPDKHSKSRKCFRRLRIAPYITRKNEQVMSQQESNPNGDIIKDFQSTGRTGRRNAMADVLGAHKDLSTSDLPLKLEKLTTSDISEAEKPNNCINNRESGTDAAVSTSATSSS